MSDVTGTMMWQFQGALSGGSGVLQHVNNNKLYAAVGDWYGDTACCNHLTKLNWNHARYKMAKSSLLYMRNKIISCDSKHIENHRTMFYGFFAGKPHVE
jgi:hypothetical protein